jgi:endonuclease/exonuclease/phosphatase (EEP) superfamily protein YafD
VQALVGSLVVVASLGSLGLAALRLTDPSARRLIELVTLAPVGLPLAALALLAVPWWRVRRRTRVTAALVAAALLLAHAAWLAPLYLGARPAGGSGSLVVLAQNFEFGDPSALVEVVREADVDVLVLTDTDDGRLGLLQDAGIESVLPTSAGLGEGGAVVFSRVPVTGTRLLYQESESRVVGLEAPGLGEVELVALHTVPPYSPDTWRSDHDAIHEALAGMREDDTTPMVLAGDLNATLAHAPVRRLLDLGFTDSAAEANAGLSPTWPSGDHQQRLGLTVPPFAAIDHVMTSPQLVVTSSATVEVAGSDHRGVLATVSAPVSTAG